MAGFLSNVLIVRFSKKKPHPHVGSDDPLQSETLSVVGVNFLCFYLNVKSKET
jgi:hypothetical protein